MKIYLSVVVAMLISYQQTAAQDTLSLEDCRKLALQNNERIMMAREGILEAESEIKANKTLFLPRLSAGATAAYLSNDFGGIIPEYSGIASGSLEQPIYTGGKIKQAYQAAKIGGELAQDQLELTREEIILRTDEAYWQVVATKEKLALARQYVEALTKLEEELQDYYQAGLIYKTDLLEVQVELNQAILGSTQARNGLRLSEMGLLQVTGQKYDTRLTVRDSVSGTFEPYQNTDAVSLALNQRTELSLLEKRSRLQEVEQKITNADFLPQIGASIGANLLYQDSDLGSAAPANGGAPGGEAPAMNLPLPTDDSYTFISALVSVDIPIFSWREKKYRAEVHNHRLRAIQYELSETKDRIAIEVQEALYNLEQAALDVQLSQVSLERAEENRQLNRREFEAGLDTSAELLEAQALWQEAYAGLIEAKTAYKVAVTRYQKAIGEL
jgi:outer membrane protein TolC